MKDQLTDRVSFEFIRYANCWEDADILLEGLAPKAGARILSIGSAGDNSFSLLLHDPGLVVAVDVNTIQLHLVELKKCCIEILDHTETLQFLGFMESTQRKAFYQKLRAKLSTEAEAYWDSQAGPIENGIIHQGKFENYFQLFAKKILPWIHSKKTVEALFAEKTEQEQALFYAKKWNSWRWRLLFKLFFSKRVMGKRGRDPEFLKEVKLSVSEYIFNKAAQQLRQKQAQHNFILRYNLTGNFGDQLPHYLEKKNFEALKKHIHKLVVFKGYAEEACAHYGKFDCMNLSNIFEYLDTDTFKQVAAGLVAGCNPGATLAYWNLMVPRRISEIQHEVRYEKEVSERLSAKDKGFFYNKFIVEKIK